MPRDACQKCAGRPAPAALHGSHARPAVCGPSEQPARGPWDGPPQAAPPQAIPAARPPIGGAPSAGRASGRAAERPDGAAPLPRSALARRGPCRPRPARGQRAQFCGAPYMTQAEYYYKPARPNASTVTRTPWATGNTSGDPWADVGYGPLLQSRQGAGVLGCQRPSRHTRA